PQVVAFMRDVRAMAATAGNDAAQIITSTKGDLKLSAERAAETYASLASTSNIALLVISAILVGLGFFFGISRIRPAMRSRHFVEKFIMGLLIACSAVAILTTIGIVFSLVFESFRFFQKVPLFDFLFGYHWSPQSAFEAAGGGSLAEDPSRVFGAIPLFVGTFLITFIAIAVAAPLGLMSAIYMSDYAGPKFRAFAKPVLEILAGIPTVVYGFFAALTVAPAIRGWGEAIGLTVSSESALAAGLVMGIMIIPFVMSLSDDVINSVPQSLRDGSYAMGATKSETIRKVILPAALPGIVSALLLAISRAVGETMIVVMAAGLAANLTINPLEAVTTVTVQIVTLLVGDQEFDSAKTLAAFALGLVLFVITLFLNIIALRVVQKYREQYD
ncbi:MAG: phosphate ABC transporter permease subunit PstC, partial [Pseudomonadota bacterium]